MTIAPNGVTTGDYDPNGIGAIVFAAAYRTDYANDIAFGEIVDGATVKLRPACIVDQPSDANDGVKINSVADAPLSGNWMCLGYLKLANANFEEAASLFMRVS